MFFCFKKTPDGVHLNDEGNIRLLTSIRGALLFAENSYNGKQFKKKQIEDKCFHFTLM